MNLWGQMIKAHYFTDPAAVQFGTAGTNDLIHYFSRGKVAMMDIGSWYEPTLTAAGLKPGRDYGAFIMPNVNPKGGPGAQRAGLALPPPAPVDGTQGTLRAPLGGEALG